MTFTKTLPTSVSLTIRRATSADAEALETIAQLDSSHVPAGPLLVAEVGGEIWAAVAIEDFAAIANPFRPAGELTFMLIERVRQIRRDESRRRPRARRRFRLFPQPATAVAARAQRHA